MEQIKTALIDIKRLSILPVQGLVSDPKNIAKQSKKDLKISTDSFLFMNVNINIFTLFLKKEKIHASNKVLVDSNIPQVFFSCSFSCD